MVNLKPGEVDFGTIYLDPSGAGISIIVYEYGLFLPVAEARYFAIGRNLHAGGAVLFAFNGARALYRPEANSIEPRRLTEGSPLVLDKATTGLRRTARA